MQVRDSLSREPPSLFALGRFIGSPFGYILDQDPSLGSDEIQPKGWPIRRPGLVRKPQIFETGASTRRSAEEPTISSNMADWGLKTVRPDEIARTTYGVFLKLCNSLAWRCCVELIAR